ncbi:MAG: methyl-accepting chemotaxis protein [Ignavibacteria bacterium]
MNALRETYDWVERTFWNTLTKKLSSFLLLFLIDLVYVGTYLKVRADVQATLARTGVAESASASIMAEFNAGLVVLLVLTALALVWNVLQILYLRHLIVRPVKTVTALFEDIGQGEGDFSRDLPLQTHDEFRQMADAYNHFAEKMRQIIGEVRKATVSIARDAVRVKVRLDDTVKSVRHQGEMTDLVFNASAEATKAIDEVSHSAQLIADSTHQNMENARASLHEMEDISARINAVSEKVLRFNHTVEDLSQRSESVNQFAALIRDVAEQTNLLALNAAIEAARAGEAGRGFAVVADEVRKLAERVNTATSEIAGNVEAMQTQVKNTRAENEEINADVQHTRQVVDRSAQQFHGMVADFERTGEQLLHIAAAMEELSATNSQVHDNVDRIHVLSGEVATHMEDSEQRTGTLATSTESVQELISRFTIGRGTFDAVVARTRQFRDAVQHELEAMARKGVDVFDKRYQPLGNHTPPKYRVSWGDEFTRRCQPLLEECLAVIPSGAYAVGVNTDGYLSCHNLKFSRALTGDAAKDLVGNRCHRKFENPGELRAARNTQPLLLRTYLRDTGEILCDIAMPIEIGGRLWGNVRVGTTADALLDMKQ